MVKKPALDRTPNFAGVSSVLKNTSTPEPDAGAADASVSESEGAEINETTKKSTVVRRSRKAPAKSKTSTKATAKAKTSPKSQTEEDYLERYDIRYAKTDLERSYAKQDPATRNFTLRVNIRMMDDLEAQARLMGKTLTDVIKEGMELWFNDNDDLLALVERMRKRDKKNGRS